MKTATFIKTLPVICTGVSEQLWKMEPPLEENEFVITSGVNAFGMGNETFIFAASEDGKVTSYLDLPGSCRGEINHSLAIRNAGYTIIHIH